MHDKMGFLLCPLDSACFKANDLITYARSLLTACCYMITAGDRNVANVTLTWALFLCTSTLLQE